MEHTTETKPDKRTKEYKDRQSIYGSGETSVSAESAPNVFELIKTGIPLQMAVFHRTILSHGDKQGGTGIPETGLFSPAPKGSPMAAKPSRTANMWFTPHGIVIEQRGRYKIIPLANVSDTNVL